nr:RecName: Full=Basic phospholipase A2 T2 A chain; Short=svPLA2; AltName: Full=Phosphatidylcholine 2-acylhydrolase T2 A [Bungarus candidus]
NLINFMEMIRYTIP